MTELHTAVRIGSPIILKYKPITPNEWNHIVLTSDYTSGKTCFYYNGQKIDEKVTAQAMKTLPTPDFIGIGPFDRHAEHIKGKISDLKIYNRALTQKEVESAKAERHPDKLGRSLQRLK